MIGWPAEFMHGIQTRQQIREQFKNEVLIRQSQAALDSLGSGHPIIQAAAEDLIFEQTRKIENKQAVWAQTLEQLKIEHKGEPVTEPDDQQSDIDPDWMNRFTEYASEASSDNRRQLWAQVLAKEITTPNTFSIRTLRAISELDKKAAHLFESLSDQIYFHSLIDAPSRKLSMADLLILEDAGLISSATAPLHRWFDYEGSTAYVLHRKHILIIDVKVEGHKVQYPLSKLTAPGEEIASIFEIDSKKLLENLAHILTNVKAARIGEIAKTSSDQYVAENVIEIDISKTNSNPP